MSTRSESARRGALPAASFAGVRLAWALCAVSLTLLALTMALVLLGWSRPLPQGFYPRWEGHLVSIIGAAGPPVLGGLIAARRPHNPYGWLWCGLGLALALLLFAQGYAAYAVTNPGTLPAPGAVLVAGGVGWTLWLILMPFLMLQFPSGRLPSRRWKPVAWTALAAGAVCLVTGPFLPGETIASVENPFGATGALGQAVMVIGAVGVFVIFGCTLLAALSLVFRYRRAGDVERQQLKWFAYAAVLFGAEIVFSGFLGRDLPGIWDALFETAALSGLYAAVGIAIFRYRLYDIDIIIKRTLVYGALTAIVVGLYVLVVGYLGVVFRTQDNLLVSLAATGLVAVLFSPLRERLQKVVDRLMYGERDEPYVVLSRLGRRLEGTLAPEAVLPTLVENVARALRLPWVGIWLTDSDTLRLGASHGSRGETAVRDPAAIQALRHAPDGLRPADLSPPGEFGAVLDRHGASLVLPLAHRGELVGALSLAPRGPNEAFSAADRRLLRDLAAQAGAAAHAVRLTVELRSSLEDLRRSRERLVAAQEEERRRIQRDLHDGLGPVLASMRLRLEACLDEVRSGDPLAADLERLYELVGQATGDIRRLVYDLRPPVLDQLGLVPALRQHCERFSREAGVAVGFEAEEGLRVPAAAEVALLRVAQEALLNVAKHANASRAEVRLERSDGVISLAVRDDGVGFDANGHGGEGAGLGSMRERAELLGGTFRLAARPVGTEVTVRIPVGETAP